MATLLAANVTNKEAEPSVKIDSSQEYGKLRVMYDSYSVDAAAELAATDVIRFMTIPKGARLIEAEVSMPASGATGIFNLGWAVSEETDIDGVVKEAADADGIIALADPGGAALERQKMLSTRPGYMKRFDAAVEVQVAMTEITADSGGDTLEVMLIVSVE